MKFIRSGIYFLKNPFLIPVKLLQLYLIFYCDKNKNKKFNITGNVVKVNLGSGLKVANGWVNLDFNLPSLFSQIKVYPLYSILYDILKKINYSELKRPYRFSLSKQKFVEILKNNFFIAHNLQYGIPLGDNSVDFYYSSHMIGFSFSRKTSLFILEETFRTLKTNGYLRLSILNGDYFYSVIKNKYKYNIKDENCFTFNEIKSILEKIGFKNVINMEFQKGATPDIDILDDYSPFVDKILNTKTLYIQAQK